MVAIMNGAGETVAAFASDAEAVRWWLDMGRHGDRLEDTGEYLSDVAADLGFVE